MATSDGAPIAWMLHRLGFTSQPRISGTKPMRAYLAQASQRAAPIFLFGGTEEALAALQRNLRAEFPALVVAGSISPPFRPITPEEDEAMVAQINASGARTVWVGLGCPKQEKWMLAHRGRVQAVMLGVGRRSTSSPPASRVRRPGCKSLGSGGCTAWPASLRACGIAIW